MAKKLGKPDGDQDWKVMEFTANLPSLFSEIARSTEVAVSPGVLTGLEIIKVSLYRIAAQAIKIQDIVILEQLEKIGCINRTR